MAVSNSKINVNRKITRARILPRNKLKIFYDLLEAIIKERGRNTRVKPTRVQQISNVSYDKLERYLKEMESLGLITDKSDIKITQKGTNYLDEYNEINDTLEKIEKKYFQ